MNVLTYKGVTPEQLKALEGELIAGGAEVEFDPKDQNATVEGHGVTSKVEYAPETLVLTVTVTSKPWIVPMSAIDNGIKKALGTLSPLAHETVVAPEPEPEPEPVVPVSNGKAKK